MAKEDSFILYTDQKAVIEKLTDKQAGQLLKALYQYVDTGQMTKLDPTLDLVITPFITTINRDKEKYERISKVRAEAGCKGGSKSKQKKQMQAKGSNCDDSDSDNDSDIIYGQFEKFYKNYPRKVKKKEVEKWFLKNKPSSELFSSIMHSLEQFRGSKDWLKDNGQYIPYPSTWLNQERWKDEIEEVDKKESENVMYLPDGSYIKDGLHYMN